MSSKVEILEIQNLDLDLYRLLRSFGMSDEGITIVMDSKYDIESLKHVDRHKLEDLLPSPYDLDRVKCIKGLNRWRISQELTPFSQNDNKSHEDTESTGAFLATDCSPIQKQTKFNYSNNLSVLEYIELDLEASGTPVDEVSVDLIPGSSVIKKSLDLTVTSGCGTLENSSLIEVPLPRSKFSATYFINKSDKAKQVIDAYRKTKYLPKDHKKIITHIVVDEFKDKFGKLTRQELADRSLELYKIFPTEPKYTWFRPTFEVKADGTKRHIGKYAKGTLYDRNVNYKPIATQNRRLNIIKPVEPVVICRRVFTPAIKEAYKETKLWFRHHEEDWEQLKTRWISSSDIRTYEILNKPERTIEDILYEYPILRNPQAYGLIQIDFQFRFPNKEELLFQTWPGIIKKLYSVFEVDVLDNGGKSLLKILEKETISDDSRDCIIFTLLTYLLPSPMVCLKKGLKRWRPTFAETREAYLMFLTDLSEVEGYIERLSTRYQQRNLQPKPLLIAVGPSISCCLKFLVYFQETYYEFRTFLKALDICYKLFKTYGLNFPEEASGPWNFLDHCIYDFEVYSIPWESKIISLKQYLRN
ncbi:uncharacterized protein LOC129756106 isoform X2 [Uranotaenia lowii]|uniref:uncharacterized protein LOC129756106 isoform X2 n=1 Tax=Uranotaenia lowii TaxID=190385 RepID=UPI0024792076|nr:uncharacterized protein LOC129756106 isoform X2 [Uranotaenia lowii]